jgi:hypothetical protein
MAGKKFSEFSTGATTDNTFIVGYDTTADTNNQYTLAQLATGLSPLIPTIYSADGTVSGNRVVTISTSNKLDFYAGGSQLLQLWGSSSGQFTLGRGASIGVGGAWCIGNSAEGAGSGAWCIGNSSVSRSEYNTVVGNSATDTAATNTYNTIIGSSASVTGASNTANIVIGDSALATTSGGVAVGSEARANGSKSISLGQRAQGAGNNSITLNATGSIAAPSTASTFGVYMSSNTTPDFRISHDGDSYITGSGKFGIGRSNITATLDVTHYDASRKLASFSDNSQAEVFSIENNGTVKITGQAYTELHTVTSAASITPDWNNSNVQTFELTSASTTIVNPSNIKPGATYILILKQDSTGGRTVSFGTQYNFPADTAPTLTTTANKADVITLVAYSSTVLMCTSVLDFTTT